MAWGSCKGACRRFKDGLPSADDPAADAMRGVIRTQYCPSGGSRGGSGGRKYASPYAHRARFCTTCSTFLYYDKDTALPRMCPCCGIWLRRGALHGRGARAVARY